uniref:Cytokinin riboside 5'-monophosphate phosphoribohydrolase n=1 Tax=Zea mays TaxID=4577 RepID=B6SUE9_MAIZE|nr:hypothetical protein [Zea mays]
MGDSAAGAPEPSRFGRICVFCGSNPGNRAVYGDAALDLGKELVAKGIDLVYGGGSVGLMGLIAQTVLGGGCSVLGVIPRALMPLEVCIKIINCPFLLFSSLCVPLVILLVITLL